MKLPGGKSAQVELPTSPIRKPSLRSEGQQAPHACLETLQGLAQSLPGRSGPAQVPLRAMTSWPPSLL